MGYGAELLEEMMIDAMIEDDQRYQMTHDRFGNVTHWITKDGTCISLKKMTITHLQNTIRFLTRKFNDGNCDNYKYKENIQAMQNEFRRRNKRMIKNVDLKVVGVTFTNEGTGERRSEIIRELATLNKEDIKIILVREPENKFDINAVKVIANDKQIGYIGKEYAQIIAPLMDEYEEFSAVVKDIGEYKNRPYCEITINQL